MIVHEHEEGEDRSKCANCAIGRLLDELSEFEAFCFSWFRTNVTQFTFDAHLIGELLRELKLEKIDKRLFLQALSMIYLNDTRISQAKARRDAKK